VKNEDGNVQCVFIEEPGYYIGGDIYFCTKDGSNETKCRKKSVPSVSDNCKFGTLLSNDVDFYICTAKGPIKIDGEGIDVVIKKNLEDGGICENEYCFIEATTKKVVKSKKYGKY